MTKRRSVFEAEWIPAAKQSKNPGYAYGRRFWYYCM